MERRELLKAGAAVGAAALASGCATGRGRAERSAGESAAPPPIPEAEMDALVARMDATLASMRQTSLVHELTPDGLSRGLDEGALAGPEDFMQRSVRSLYVSGIFLDRPAHARAHAGLQERVVRAMPDMESSVRDSYAILASLGDEQHAQIREMLHRQPDLCMRVAEALDARAAEVGISRKRRMQLRSAAVEIGTRMRRQHPATVVQEYLAKTEKVYERHGGSELRRQVAARAGEQLFWARLAQSDPAIGPAPPAPATRSPGAVQSPPPLPGSGALKAAAWMFGIGAASLLTGLLIVEAGASPGVFVITVGVLLLLAAFITLIVGIIIRAASHP